MPAFALVAASVAARAASLNLCTDEYLLLLATPGEVVSVSYLSRDPLESPLWREARRHPGNRGSIEDVLALRPNLLLTMGSGGRATSILGPRIHMRTLDLPYPADLAGVASNLRSVATALGARARAEPWLQRLRALVRTAPPTAIDAAWVSGGGQSLAPDSLGARWLRLAGYRQQALAGNRLSLEAMLTKPPNVLVRSDYRSGQMSAGLRWFDNPIVRSAPARRVTTDGRAWTCMGPLMIPEIERLRRARR